MMRTISIPALFLMCVLCFIVGAHSAHAQAAPSKENAFIKLLQKYDDAWNRKDLDTVDKILARNYIYFSSTGSTTARAQTLEFLRSPAYILRSAKRSELLTILGENTAIIGSRWMGSGSYNDKEFNDDQRCSIVFTLENKNLKILSEHCTQIVSK